MPQQGATGWGPGPGTAFAVGNLGVQGEEGSEVSYKHCPLWLLRMAVGSGVLLSSFSVHGHQSLLRGLSGPPAAI